MYESYTCDQCEYGAIKAYDLKKHKEDKHGGKRPRRCTNQPPFSEEEHFEV